MLLCAHCKSQFTCAMQVMMYNLVVKIKHAQSVDCILQPFLYVEETRTQLLYYIVVPGEDIRPEILPEN